MLENKVKDLQEQLDGKEKAPENEKELSISKPIVNTKKNIVKAPKQSNNG